MSDEKRVSKPWWALTPEDCEPGTTRDLVDADGAPTGEQVTFGERVPSEPLTDLSQFLIPRADLSPVVVTALNAAADLDAQMGKVSDVIDGAPGRLEQLRTTAYEMPDLTYVYNPDPAVEDTWSRLFAPTGPVRMYNTEGEVIALVVGETTSYTDDDGYHCYQTPMVSVPRLWWPEGDQA